MVFRHGLYTNQIDLGWRFIQGLALVGLATNINTPASLPRRSGITPLTRRALTAAPSQA